MREKDFPQLYFMVNGRKEKMSDHLFVRGPSGEIIRNGIGIASSPATETLHQWRELWKYGAGYIVIKTANHEMTYSSPLQTRINTYKEGALTTLENIGKTSIEQKPIEELVSEIKTAREEGIFVIPSIASKNPDLSVWQSMIDAVSSTGVPYFESTLRYPYRGIMQQVVNELRAAYDYFDFDYNEYSVGITPIGICEKTGLNPRYIETETNRRFEIFLKLVGEYSKQKGIGMIAKLWGGRHDIPALVATCALAGMKGITLVNSFQSPPLREFPDMKEYKRANVSGGDLRRIRNSSLEAVARTFVDNKFPRITLFASGGVAVELASKDRQNVDRAIDDIILCLELGADMVQLYTAIHQDYTLLGTLIRELGLKLEEDKTFKDLGQDRSRFTGQNRPIYRLFRINQDTCIGCGICEKTTYCDAIWPSSRQAAAVNKKLSTFEIHLDDCTGCGLCATVCPVENTIVPFHKERGKE
ncbi:4Fe-4S binding protein [Candidatus Daviesbacteria bacterium]|nr:4Fe-4S binding protein [Candidatus Daviesbacteria bacterium]MBI2622487.1 4Fe-4S binding protein [Candidatus Levybacteria bacterium]